MQKALVMEVMKETLPRNPGTLKFFATSPLGSCGQQLLTSRVVMLFSKKLAPSWQCVTAVDLNMTCRKHVHHGHRGHIGEDQLCHWAGSSLHC